MRLVKTWRNETNSNRRGNHTCATIALLYVSPRRGNIEISQNTSSDDRETFDIFRNIGDRRSEGITLSSLGDAFLTLEDTPTAIRYYEEAYQVAVEVGDSIEEAVALWKKSNALAASGDVDQAIQQAEAALAIFEKIESPLIGITEERLNEWKMTQSSLRPQND